ncbi:hypothetical protein [Nitrospirillum amazonense]|uniref:hypothetical protein n=1 Tax=Nitrospirillum amazonense TaxID=28077 RepID=UPI0011A738D2|nr:hypothetical protein [Nitrospirillum amazonense]
MPDEERLVGPGNDPRIALISGRPIVLFRGALQSPQEYYLYDVRTDRLVPINVSGLTVAYGKNWMPFDLNGDVGAVHGFDPFRILRVSPETGAGLVLESHRCPWAPRAPHDRYAMMRGGANALVLGDVAFGLGHATFDPYRHVPFQWRKNAEGELSVEYTADFEPIIGAGFGIIDPTSILETGRGSFVGACCSERDWFFDQRFLNVLLPAKILRRRGRPSISVDTSAYAALPRAWLTTADVLQANIPGRPVPYAARRVEQAGFAMFGPYESISPGRYRFSFRYSSEAEPAFECGWCDVAMTRPRYSRANVRVPLMGTGGAIRTVDIECVMRLPPHEVHETRIYSNGIAPLTAYDVRVCRLEELPESIGP